MKFTSSNLKPTLIRSIFMFAIATFAAALIWTTLASQPSQAQEADDSDISWQGESLVYDGNTYTGPASESIVSSLGLREDTVAYTYTEPSSTTDRKTHVIYFAPGSDPGTADGANYRVYDYDGPGLFSNGNTPVALTLAPATEESVSSCQVEGGLGWFICPATNTLATFMDYLFGVLTGFLEVKPAQTDEENALYRAWSIMRTFANIAFVIAFLLIIYSQLTNFGISNYGIKKLLPRIIIAAILMNVSYIVCSLAIDISNLLGYGLQGIFINIRNSLVGLEGNTWEVTSWESVTSFVLAGSVAGVGAGIATISAVTASGGVGAAAVAILLPALVVVMFAVLVALLVLAARQAIITILVVISPLAFVAFLLPNTDKWFDKWRGLFMTMLLLFPAFSLIFGGSQLAGAVIIQNATSINVIILGLLIQAAPLYVTPMLIKLSGSLIGRIAGMVNNPNRGIIDRTRNFAKDRAENMKAKNLSTPAKKWEIGKQAAQRYDHNRRRREGWRNVHNAQADANWAQTADFQVIDGGNRNASREKQFGEAQSEAIYLNQLQQKGSELLERELKLRVTVDEVTLEKSKLDAIHEELRAGHSPAGASEVFRQIQKRQEDVSRDIAISGIRKSQASQMHASMVNKDILKSAELQREAQGVATDGGASMLANVVARDRKEIAERIADQQQLMTYFKLESNDYQNLAMNKADVEAKDSDGNIHKFTFNNEYVKEAAISHQFNAGSYGQKMEIINESGEKVLDKDGTYRKGVNYNHRDTIQESVIKSNFSSLAPFVNDKSFDQILKGEWSGQPSMSANAIRQVIEGRIKPAGMLKANANALKVMFEMNDLRTGTAVQQAEFNKYKQMFIDMLPADQRASKLANFDAEFESKYKRMVGVAKEILDNPMLAQDANDESRTVLTDYVNRYTPGPNKP